MDFFHTPCISDIMEEGSKDPATGVLPQVLAGVLRPLVRMMIARGITAPAFYRMMKRLFVEVAEADFGLEDGSRQTDSRISILTGVHRRDVRDYRSDDAARDNAVEAKVTVITSVLGRWMASADTTSASGRPIALPRGGEAPVTFDKLVRSVNKDVRPKTVLDELLRQDLVVTDDEGLLHLRAEAFVGPEDFDQKVFFFGENVGDHIAAATDNLLSDQPPYLERALFYNRLTAASIDTIEHAAREQGTELLNNLNRLAHERQSQDVADGKGDERFRFGIFFYRTPDGPETDPPKRRDGDDE